MSGSWSPWFRNVDDTFEETNEKVKLVWEDPWLVFPNRCIPAPKEHKLIHLVAESCVFKSGMAAVMGAGFGALIGIAFGGFDTQINPDDPWRKQMKDSMRASGQRAWGNAKGFAVFGAAITLTECTIETVRAKHDIINPILAGCITGAGFARSGGPKAMAGGCAGMAAFSAAIDHFLKPSF